VTPRYLRVAVVGFVAALTACGPPGGAAPVTSEARIVSTVQIDERSRDLTVDSPAIGRTVSVRLLVPARFDADPTRRWPVLYLLHGCCDSYVAWTRSTDIAERTRPLDVLVAMPEGGAVGFYSDWRSGPGWETFHTDELPRLLAAEYRADDRQAVAGLSMGGLGALTYAAHHPGRYAAAASFSGIVHTRLTSSTSQNYLGLIQSQGEDPAALWGDPATDDEIWRRHNPYDLVPALRGTPLYISAGDGRPGPLDAPDTPADQIETSIGAENRAFADRLRSEGVDARINLYGAGTHNWVYWQRELDAAWPLLTSALGLTS
jgi:diacylglycerol O-acyltransferase / trehalose O-mycolyltransferase / mycolyltransferase Ag85